MNDMELKYRPILSCSACGHSGTDYNLALRGVHTSCFCAKCHTWIKHLSKDDKYRTVEKVDAAKRKTGGACAYCGTNLSGAVALDHIHPKSKGGSHHPDNLFAVCRSCNSTKGKKTIEEYRTYMKRKTGKLRLTFFFEDCQDINI